MTCPGKPTLIRVRSALLCAVLVFLCSIPLSALDDFVNFGRATVSTGYNSSVTSIALTSGHGARLPTVTNGFNCTWYNSTDYPDPANDPSREIVRVTGRSTDTLTITRGQESTSAANHNTGGKTYALDCTLTAKTLTDITTALSGALYSGGSLGTPSAGVATNLTGTAAGLVAGASLGDKTATTTVDCSASAAPSAGQVKTATDSTHCTWQTLPTAMAFGSITGTSTLTSSDCGGIYLLTGTSADYAVNLPSAPSDGCPLVFKGGGTTALTKLVTVTKQGSDVIEWSSGTVTSFVMWSGEYCGLAYKSSIATWEKIGCLFIPMKGQSEQAASQSVSDSTLTQLLLDTNTINVGAMWRSGSNDFLIRRTGTYRLSAMVSGIIDTGDALHVLAFKNTTSGTRVLRHIEYAVGNTEEHTPESTDLVQLTAGDTVQLVAWQVTGGALTVPSGSLGANNRLSIQEVIP